MVKLPILFLAPFLLSAYSPVIQEETDPVNEMIKADSAMSVLAGKEGFNAALKQYADENMVKYYEGAPPMIGLDDFIRSTGGKAGPKEISWEPEYAESSASGDLGFTRGSWVLQTADTTYYGVYVTIWKKQSDGTWKWVFDSGNGTPKP